MSRASKKFDKRSNLSEEDIRLLEGIVETQHQIRNALEWSVKAIEQMQRNYEALEERMHAVELSASRGEQAWGRMQPLGGRHA